MSPSPVEQRFEELSREQGSIFGDVDLSDTTSTADNPELASSLSEQALESANEKPKMEEMPDGQVELPGGWIDADGNLHTRALVRELNGRDEEKMSRIDPQKNLPLLLQTMAKCGLESIDGIEPTERMFNDLLVGDREMLILGIRVATYGDNLPMHITCPSCRAEEDLELELMEDIPISRMEHPEQREYTVELRHGRSAIVTPLTVQMQDQVWDPKKSLAEVKTDMLEKCVVAIDGRPVGRQEVLDLGLGDRNTLLDRLQELQPGPDLSGIQLPCQSCGQDFALGLDLNDLFR